MRLFSATVFVTLLSLSCGRPQQGIDPAYLRQYYQQLAQNTGAQAPSDGTPIYESESRQDSAPRYLPGGQQIRIKDTVNEQIQRTQQPAAYTAPQARQYQIQQQQQPQQVQYVQQQQYQQPQQHQQQQQQQQPQQSYKAPQPKPRPQQYKGNKYAENEDPDYDDANQSYQFGFDVKDDEFTNYQNRKEQRDGDVIKGSYSVVDSDGFIRTVKYTADPKEGFRAEVTREPTDIVVKVPVQKPDHEDIRAQPQQHHHNQLKQQQPQQFHQQPQYSQQVPAGAYRAQQPKQQQQQQQQQSQYHQYQ